MKKLVFSLVLFFSLGLLAAPSTIPAQAGTGWLGEAQSGLEKTKDTFGAKTDIKDIISSIIKSFLGLMGIIFVIYLVWAGFNYMTAGGDEDKVSKALDQIRNAIIGIVIIAASYGIATFVFSQLMEAVK